jgi:hypothetical protein
MSVMRHVRYCRFSLYAAGLIWFLSLGNTNCFPDAVGTGPNPNDCSVIADAILFDSENVGALFVTNPAVRSLHSSSGSAYLTVSNAEWYGHAHDAIPKLQDLFLEPGKHASRVLPQ